MEDATTPDDQALRTRKTGDRTPPSAERASTKQKTEVEEAVDTPVASPPPSSGGHATDTGTQQPPAFAERLESVTVVAREVVPQASAARRATVQTPKLGFFKAVTDTSTGASATSGANPAAAVGGDSSAVAAGSGAVSGTKVKVKVKGPGGVPSAVPPQKETKRAPAPGKGKPGGAEQEEKAAKANVTEDKRKDSKEALKLLLDPVRRDLVEKICGKMGTIFFQDVEGYDMPFRTEEAKLKRWIWMPSRVNIPTEEEEEKSRSRRFIARLTKLRLLFIDIVNEGSSSSRLWKAFFEEQPERKRVDAFPEIVALVASNFAIRVTAECTFSAMTDNEKYLLTKYITLAIDERVIVASNIQIVPGFAIRALFLAADTGSPRLVFPGVAGAGDPVSRWMPKEGGTNPSDGLAITSLKKTAIEIMDHESKSGHHSSPHPSVIVKAPKFVRGTYTIKMGSTAEPHVAVLFRAVVAPGFKLAPPMRECPNPNTTGLLRAVKKASVCAPLDTVAAVARCFPAWFGGLPADSNFPESAVESEKNARGDVVRVFLREGKVTPTLRDKLVAAIVMRWIGYADAKKALEVYEKIEMDEFSNDVGVVFDAKDRDLFLIPPFDSWGGQAQLVILFQMTVAVEFLNSAVLHLDAALARKTQSLAVVCYATRVRAWLSTLSDASGFAKDTSKCKDPPVRRLYVLTLVSLRPVSQIGIAKIGDGVHQAVPRAIRLAEGALATIGPVAKRLFALTDESLERMQKCVTGFQSEFKFASFETETETKTRVATGAETDAHVDKPPVITAVLALRASSAENMERENSLLAQLVTAAWVIRRMNLERKGKKEKVVSPSEIVVTIAAGSKLYPARIDRFIVYLDPRGEAWKALHDFGWKFELDKAALQDESLNDLIYEEIVDAVLPVAQLCPPKGSEWKVLFAGRCAYVPGGWEGAEVADHMRVGEHTARLGCNVLADAIDHLISKGPNLEKAAASVFSIYTSTHDRLETGMVNEIGVDRVLSVVSLAAEPLLAVRSHMRCDLTGGIDARAGWHAIEHLALLGSVCTAEFSLTQRVGVLEDSEVSKVSKETSNRASVYATCVAKLIAHAFPRLVPRSTSERPVDKKKSLEDVILYLRRSNTSEALGTQVRRTIDLMRRREEQRGARYTRLHIVTLDTIKGKEEVPVWGGNHGDRAIYFETMERDAINLNDLVQDQPRGNRTIDAFVVGLVTGLIEGNRCDVLVPAVSRVCLRGALEAFAGLFVGGGGVSSVSIFSWDLWHAAMVNRGIKALLMDDDFRIRVEEPAVRQSVEEIARADRMWRLANGFVLPIWD